MRTDPADWTLANQRFLVSELGRLRAALERHRAQALGDHEHTPDNQASNPVPLEEEWTRERQWKAAPAILVLQEAFGLSRFERDILLLCAGVELDARLAEACGAAQGETRRTSPTFGLALAAFPDAHWSALSPSAPLRRYRLLELSTGESLTGSPLRVDERVLHFLTGVAVTDERLVPYLERVTPSSELIPSEETLATRIVELCSSAGARGRAPCFQVFGRDSASHRSIFARVCQRLGLQLVAVTARDLPASPVEREQLTRLLEREVVLSSSALLLETHGTSQEETSRARGLLERLSTLVFVSAREPLHLEREVAVTFEAPSPGVEERARLWQQELGPLGERLNGSLLELASLFNLPRPAVRRVSHELALVAGAAPLDGAGIEDELHRRCRIQARQGLEELVQRIDSEATFADLVLPPELLATLGAIAAQLRHRATVYEQWGFATRGARGLGISALFSGPSGTGKTLASEVLANHTGLDLYRIDLSQVVSKYIGETEKNLARIFDAADRGGAILLFDEADAVFGKRTEVKDSHDRYANIEVSYLLQRMEEYRGLAVLTTNNKEALDSAFLRRLRFVLKFPFPGPEERRALWMRAFPPRTPTLDLDFRKLAELKVSGGSIRNIALGAAFLAAENGRSVSMTDLLSAARAEFDKLEKPWSTVESHLWQ